MSPTATSVLLVAHLLTLATMMGLVLAAAIGDIKTYRIPNAVSFALLALAGRIADTVRELTSLRADVELLADDGLPNDGLVIEDTRKLD